MIVNAESLIAGDGRHRATPCLSQRMGFRIGLTLLCNFVELGIQTCVVRLS